MKLLDRFLLRGYFQSYAICFFTLISLYIIIDMFSKLDEFSEQSAKGWLFVLESMGRYYLYQSILIFNRLCGVIVLLASMFTVAWMQRNNELIPLLSAGISMRRVLYPIFLGTLVMLGISTVNREILMPRVADQLRRPAEDPHGEKLKKMSGVYEPNGILIHAEWGVAREQVVYQFGCNIPDKSAGSMVNFTAEKAYYLPPGQGPDGSAGWLLKNVTKPDLAEDIKRLKEPILQLTADGDYFLRAERVDFKRLSDRSWYEFASTWEIFFELRQADSSRLAEMAIQLHQRLTLPFLTLIMVMMGLALLLGNPNRNIFLSAGLCLLLAGVFYGVCFLCAFLGEREYFTPPLAAWLPVLFFGPLAFTMLDAIHS